MGAHVDRLRTVVRKALAILKRVREEALAVLDDRRMASQDQDRLHPFKRFLHFWVLVGRSFLRNRCMVRATALAYTTLLSLIPLLAVGLGVATSLLKTDGTQTHDMIERVVENLAPQLGLVPNGTPPLRTGSRADAGGARPASVAEPTGGPAGEAVEDGAMDGVSEEGEVEGEVEGESVAGEAPGGPGEPAQPGADAREAVIEAIQGFIDNINSAGLNVLGMLALILVAIGLLSTIEMTFNDIWGVTRGRSWLARLVQYWAAITLGPLILVFATTFAVGSQFDAFQDKVFEWMGPGMATMGRFLLGVGATILPLILVSVAFALLYQLMPATAVNWKAAAVGGFMGGLLWWLNGQLSVVFASKVVSTSRIYGSLGILPVFLLGLYLSWLILLFGCQVSYAYQNRRAYLLEKQAESMSPSAREFVALRMMTVLGQRFQAGQLPPSLSRLADELGVSSRLLLQVVQRLKAARLVGETSGSDPGYLPARPLDSITCADVLGALRDEQGEVTKAREGEARTAVGEVYASIRAAGHAAAENHTLLDLIQRGGVGCIRGSTANT